MAQQKQVSTWRQDRVDLIGSIHNRDSSLSKDQRFINFYQESTKNPLSKEPKKYLVKRPGISIDSTVVGGGAVARGCYFYEGSIYSVLANKVYKDTSEIQTLATSTGSIGWSEASGVTKYLFLCDGTDGYVITTAGVISKVNSVYSAWTATTNYALGDTVIPVTPNGFYYTVTADAGSSGASQPTWPTVLQTTVVDGGITWICAGNYGGFPSPHIPKPAFLDGYIFLLDSNTTDIYNSDLENPKGWSTANFIAAEMWPDDSVALSRQNNQIVVFGRESIEFLYDAGTSGTPLQRNDTVALEIGLAGVDTIYQDEKQMIFVGQSGMGGRAVWMLIGFQPTKISYEGIERVLDAEGASITNAKAIGIRSAGHLFYILNLTSKTLVYIVDEGVWCEWSTNVAGAHSKFVYSYATDKRTGVPVLLHDTNGSLYTLNTSVYQDAGVDIIAELFTSKLDFGNMNYKAMYSMEIIGDTTSSSSPITFRWSDDDYKTWSNWKTVDLVSRPYFKRLGSFRRRAFNIKHTDNAPIRLEALEFDVNQGVV